MGSSARSDGLVCPTCKGAVDVKARPRPSWFPFCCERCQLVDLGKWIDEEYRVGSELPPSLDGSQD